MMKLLNIYCNMKNIICSIFLLYTTCSFAKDREEMIPYGDMNQWQVRYIKESSILGGKTKTLYAIAPNDTISKNIPYRPIIGNPWATSNTYAKWIVETAAASAVTPEKRGNGYCCRLENKITHIKFGNIYAMVTGSIFFGLNLEPVGISAKEKPYTAIDFGIPYTQHPRALKLDYKAIVENVDFIVSTERNKIDTIYGQQDCVGIVVYLQHRWEDNSTGKIYAYRVGSASKQILESTTEWVNDCEIPIIWGDNQKSSILNPNEQLNATCMMTHNSRGNMVKIEEVGYSSLAPTHVVLQISASWAGAFRAYEGNILWVDNIRWVYEE